MPPKLNPKFCLRLSSPYMVQNETQNPTNNEPTNSDDITLSSLRDTLPQLTPFNSTEETVLQHCLQTLKPFDPAEYRNTLVPSEAEWHDCEWIKHVTAYQLCIGQEDREHILRTDDPLRLWISGGLSTDRTSLSLFITEELERCRSQPRMKIQVLYFFCHRPHHRRNSAEAVIKGLLYQLVGQRPDLTRDVCDWLSDRENRFFHLDDATAPWNALLGELKNHNSGTTFCIVDGLHECEEDSTRILETLFSKPFPKEKCFGVQPALKLIVTSQASTNSDVFGKIDLDERLKDEPDTPLVRKHRAVDDYFHQLAPKGKHTVAETLERIAAYRHPPTISQLQTSFEESESEILERLQTCGPITSVDDMGIVQCIHSNIWRVFSVSPVASVLHAVLARQSLTLIQQELPKLDIEDLEEDPSIWFETIPSDVQYAISHWATHIKLSMEVSDELLNLVVTTFSRNSLTIDKWFIIYLYMNYNISQQDTGEHHHTTVLHLFAFFNLHELLQKAFDSPLWGRLDKYVTTLDALQNDPLALALSQNYTETARLLLSTEVRINLSHVIRAAHSSKEIAEDIFSLYERDNENGHEPISRATMAAILDGAVINGGEEIVACTVAFLKRTASGDAIPSHDTDALKYVIETGQHHLLALLLPIVDLESTAVELICAATSCHGEFILADLLLVPQIWHAVSEDKTALLYCLNLSLQHKCPVMVERLITNDNMHQSDEEGQTPLWIAVNHLNVQTLRCFLRRKDFFFNRKSIEEGVALNFLLHKDKTEAPVHLMNLKKILERGARMQYKHFGITSFHVAAELGRPEVMKVLLEYMSAKEIEVDIDQKPSAIHGPEKDYLTALMIAALKGHGEIVKLLLAAGADTKATDRQGKTAMMLASEAGHREIQEILGKVTSKQREVSTELEIGNTMEEEEPKKEPKKGRKRKGKRK